MYLKDRHQLHIVRKRAEAPMIKALVVGEPDEFRNTLKADLKRVGVHVVGATDCQQMVQDTIRLAPDIVVISVTLAGEPLFAATALLENLYPVAVAAFTEDLQVESMERAMSSGIHAWILHGYRADRLRSVLQLAQVRFRREKQQREALAELTHRLEERKLVDRAKGILMGIGDMPEEQAFRTLREAAMQGKLRLGQVAQRLIDAAHSAEAINRAGQLRMLSQRLVKLHLLAALDVEPHSAQALRAASIERLTQNFSALGELLSVATFGDLLDEALASWRALSGVLAGDAQPMGVHQVNAAAERLLQAAEQLTAALESASPIARMQLVNLAGRQRMLAQRIAKLALLDALVTEPERQAMAEQARQAIASFEDTMATLRDAPLTTPKDRTTLDAGKRAWDALRAKITQAHLPQGRLHLAQLSEELLEIFDQLTESYEHSLKVLVG
jgi:AmiR/NasT family two-component response regulator